MAEGENQEPSRICIEVNVPKWTQKVAVLRLRYVATVQSAAEATLDLNRKTVCFSIVLSKNDNFKKSFIIFMKFTEDGPPLPPMWSLH
jgi:hypothetical protein